MQLSTTALLPIVDAIQEGEGTQVLHVESKGSADCPTRHDHLFCHICRVVGLAGREARTIRAPALTAGVPVVPAAMLRPPASERTGLHAPVGSRAPPKA
jgi:hypothetical protein